MLKKAKVAIFSDLHLGLYANSTDWHDIALKWADWMVGDFTEKGIEDVFFLGDFFHNRAEISVQTVHVASVLLDKFKKFNMLMVVGNHDAFYKNRADVHSLALLKGHDNLTIIDKTLEFEAFDKTFAFIPWNVECSDISVDYLFGHFEIQGFNMNNYKLCDHGLSPVDLVTKNGMVFSGHFHKRHFKKYSQGTIHYVGSTFHHDFNDVGNSRGYHILDVESGDLEFIENTISPEFKKLSLSKIKSYSEEDVKGHIIKLIVDKDLDSDKVEKLKAYLGKYGPFQLQTEYNVVSKNILEVEEIDSIELVEMMDEFVTQLSLEKDQNDRVSSYLTELYEKNKI
jgi:DNA repair exonuclease SbcCD nuclease subunit